MKAVHLVEQAVLRVIIPLEIDKTQALSDSQNCTRKPGTYDNAVGNSSRQRSKDPTRLPEQIDDSWDG